MSACQAYREAYVLDTTASLLQVLFLRNLRGFSSMLQSDQLASPTYLHRISLLAKLRCAHGTTEESGQRP